ncbi:hypothetical protein EXIGLDRAFT_832596 [Exidia glandulosa HHB12029]|uniref:HNH nuclease domain-containing protein n=1 Tax=Exidia glandulosa HHB12029 TaxID=1314781 RepID=A0A165LHG4_EXIGL|nr:hypothetical protein EXIGLDRAFT_832596 [Exidia glandulosa HHB12029]
MTSGNITQTLAEGRAHLQRVVQCRKLQTWDDIAIWIADEPGSEYYTLHARASSLQGKLTVSELLEALGHFSETTTSDGHFELVPFDPKLQVEGSIPHPISGIIAPGTYAIRHTKKDTKILCSSAHLLDDLHRSIEKYNRPHDEDREWDYIERNSPTSLAHRAYARDNMCVMCNAAGRSDGSFHGDSTSPSTLRPHRIVPQGILEPYEMGRLGVLQIVQDPFACERMHIPVQPDLSDQSPEGQSCSEKYYEARMKASCIGLNSLENTMTLCLLHSQWMDRSYVSVNPETRRIYAFHPIARDFHGLDLRRPFAHANDWLPAPHMKMLRWHFYRSILGWIIGCGHAFRYEGKEDKEDDGEGVGGPE